MKLNTYAIALTLTCLFNTQSQASEISVTEDDLKPFWECVHSQIIPGKIMNTIADLTFLPMALVAPAVMPISTGWGTLFVASSLSACAFAKTGAFLLHEIDNHDPATYNSLSEMLQHAVSGKRYIWGNIETLSAMGLATVPLVADSLSPNVAYWSRLALGALGGYAFIKDFEILNKTAPITPPSDEEI